MLQAMTLRELLARADLPSAGSAGTVTVTGVSDDSRRVTPGNVFVAVPGVKEDGTRYAGDAVAAGAIAVIAGVPRPVGGADLPWIVVAEPRHALAAAAAAFLDFPARKLCLTAVTGSKGKTTTSFLTAAIADVAGEDPALITTVLHRIGQNERPARLTTPGALELQSLLAEAVDAGHQSAVIEASSHAIDQARLHGLRFEAAIFTNLFPDHLDYHESIEDYFNAKRQLFVGDDCCRRAVIGIDGRHGRRLASEHPEVTTFGTTNEADVQLRWLEATRQGTRIVAGLSDGDLAVDSPLLGRHNAQNLLAAIAYGVARGFDREAIRAGVRQVGVVPGRMEPVDLGQPFTCLVDFAHTGPALTAALESAREWTSGRLLVVFGAGGNRDRERRTSMGQAAAKLASHAFLTSDNPRDENPAAIITDIEVAYRAAGGDDAAVFADRAEAIAAAVRSAQPGDTVIVAGKGHEREQIIGTKRLPFDDRAVIREALALRGYEP